MTYKGYIAQVKLDEEAKTFYGEILNSSAIIHFRGESVAALEKSFHEGVDEYLETCKEERIDPERTFSGEFRLRISPELHRKIFLYAKQEHISLNSFVKESLEEKVLKEA